MKKLLHYIKKTLKAIFWVVLVFVLLFLILAGIIQIPSVQNKIVHYATTFVSNKTHTKVEIKNVSISFPKSVVLQGLYLEDLQKDTLIYVGEAKINIVLKDLFINNICIRNFELENLTLHLHNTKADSVFNYNFLLAAFADTTIKVTDSTEIAVKWTFSLDEVSLKNVRVRYNDEFGGMDISATLDKLELSMDEIDFEKSVYRIDNLLIEKLRAKVLMKESSKTEINNRENILPKIMANNIRINNSTLIYNDLTNQQTVQGTINRFEIKKGKVDLEKETVELDRIRLSESDIQYITVDAETVTDSTLSISNQTTKSDWKVTVKYIDLKNNVLTYKAGNQPILKNTFDAGFMKFHQLNLKATDLIYSSDSTKISVVEFNAVDQNNFAFTRFETDFSMDKHSITAKKLKANTKNSSINADVNIQFNSLQTLVDSLPFMGLNINLKNAKFKNSDILYFSPELIEQDFFKSKTNITTISGLLTGRVNHLKGKNLFVKTGTNTILETDCNIIGLPEVETAFFDFPNLKVVSGQKDIKMFAGSDIPENINLPGNIALLVVFKGKIKSFASTIGLKSSYGNADIEATIDPQENFKSKMNVANFDLGSLLKDKVMYGPLSLTAQVDGKGFDMKTITAKVKAEVTAIYLNKYTYHNLKVDGNVNGQEFAGKVNLNDPNAVFDFDGLVNLNPENEQFKFNLNVEGADLQKLQLTKDDMRIGFMASADLKGGKTDKMNGNAGITLMTLVSNGKKYVLDSVLLASINKPKRSEFNVSSAIIDLKYSGTISPVALFSTLTQFTNNYFPFTDAKPGKNQNDSSNFNFEIQLHNHPILSEVLLPQLREFEPGVITGSFDSRKNDLKLNANMHKIVYGTTEINDLVMNVNSDSTALNYKISSSEILTPQMKFENFLFDGKLADNKILANFSSINSLQNKKLLIRSEITKEEKNYKLILDPKNFWLMNDRWDIAADNYIEFGKQGFLIHHLFLNNGVSQINVASVHNKFNDDLNIEINNFKLDDISRIFEKDTAIAKGNVDGNILLKRVNNSYGIIADASVTNLIVRDVPVGNLTLKADNPTAERFDIDLNLSGVENNVTTNGYFTPNGGDNSLNIKTVIQSLSMKTIEAFSMGQISETSGRVTGNFLINGKTDAPDLTGELTFENVFLKPAYLNNRLELKHETVQLKTDGIYFNSFTMLDVDQHKATIDGTVKMKQFSDFVFALNINTRNFLLLNTTAKDNKEFYGRMIIDSRIDVKGPMSLPIINGRVKLRNGSNFTFVVPEDKLTTDKGEDVVEFEDSILLSSILDQKDKKEIQKSGFTGFELSSIIEVDKEATLRLLLDPTSADSLVVRGEAALSFTMDRSGNMNLTGTYNLNEGSYLISLESVIKKKFDIVPGSTITWNGDPLDADIAINASYAVRAAPYDLVADQMEGLSDIEKGGYKQRYPFLVLLKLRGAILKPEISFEIQLQPEDKGILGGAVNQKLVMLNDDPSLLNKQVFALLVLGRFVQENPLLTESGGTSSLVRSSVSNFLSAQLNKLSSKIVPGVDLNFDIQSYDDYGTGKAQGRTQVEIGLKKQLFDERLSVQIGGLVDVEGEKAKQNSASNITSDVTVEYKLTKDGRYRLKGSRHNQYEGAIEGQLVETGVGVVLVKDFNKWKENTQPLKGNKRTPNP
ncbi:MAG: translocation/assembly module TamB domain-containing protein [Paludibacter sp.]|nr:translocation/assembly module TamB domain-containing protein [Paludibacter sp.]